MKKLTPRESETLKLLAHGRSQKEIAGDMQLSVRTIDTYIKRIKEKTHLQKATELVAAWWVIHKGSESLRRRILEAGAVIISVVAVVLGLFENPEPLNNVQTNIPVPGTGGLELLFGAVILLVVLILLSRVFNNVHNE